MQTILPFWNGSGTFVANLSKHIAAGYGFYDGTPPAPTIYTTTVTVTPSGGVPPYTYAWTEVGGPIGISVQSATAASTKFYEMDASGAWSKTAYWICTVTDATAATAATSQVEVIIEQSTLMGKTLYDGLVSLHEGMDAATPADYPVDAVPIGFGGERVPPRRVSTSTTSVHKA